MALPHKTCLHVHKLHRLGNLVGRTEVKSLSLLNFCPPSPTSGWMQHELWRRQSRICKSCTARAVSAPCVGGYRCDPQMWCSSHQCQHSLQAQLTHTEPLRTLTHDPAASQHTSTGWDSFPLKLCRHIPCKARDSHLSGGFSAPAPSPRATFPGLTPHKGQH